MIKTFSPIWVRDFYAMANHEQVKKEIYLKNTAKPRNRYILAEANLIAWIAFSVYFHKLSWFLS